MLLRVLVGPLSRTAATGWEQVRAAGSCRAFNSGGDLDLAVSTNDTWDSLCQHLPADWRPDAVVLGLTGTVVPELFWSAPVPVIGLAADADLCWHGYRHLLPRCDLVFTDAVGLSAMRRCGCEHGRPARLFGLPAPGPEDACPPAERDIDILVLADLHPALQHRHLCWLGRLAPLATRWRVVIQQDPFAASTQALLSRARIFFSLGGRGSSCPRALEALAAGALVCQPAEDDGMDTALPAESESIVCRSDDLETLLAYFLSHEEERRARVQAGQRHLPACRGQALCTQLLEAIEQEWPALQERARRRLSADLTTALLAPFWSAPSQGGRGAWGDRVQNLLARTWQALSATQEQDSALMQDLREAVGQEPGAAALHQALGLVVCLDHLAGGALSSAAAQQAAEHFQAAVANDPQHVVATLNLIEALVGLGEDQLAIDGARRLLAQLDRQPAWPGAVLDAGHFPPVWDVFRVEWERAGWENAGAPAAETEAKRTLVRWRLHGLLLQLTGELAHAYEAVVARPDLALSRAALGSALHYQGRSREAIPHLRRALTANPFDGPTARILFAALEVQGDADEQHRLQHQRHLLARAAPQRVAEEPWFQPPAPPTLGRAVPLRTDRQRPSPQPPVAIPSSSAVAAPGERGRTRPAGVRPRVSLCLIVKNEEHNLPACLNAVSALVDDLVIVDTGSTDATREVAARYGARLFDFSWRDSFAAARNECLRHATGEWIFWLDADDRLDEDNRHRLRRLFASLGEDKAAYVMKCLCLPDAVSGTATVVDHVRLFRNHPQVRWRYRVHEQILPALRQIGAEVRWTDVVIHHAGYQDPALRRRKLERDLRLLLLEEQEQPDDPFVLFNLGSVYQEQGRHAEALPRLRRSLERSRPGDSIVRKLYALMASCHRALGQREQAQVAIQEGLQRCPEDTELLFVQSNLYKEAGDRANAKACLLRLLTTKPVDYFASVDAGLRGYKARHNLALLHLEDKQLAEAEEHWRAAVAERPDFLPAWLGLGDIQLLRRAWPAVEEVARQLAAAPKGAVESAVLRARAFLAQGQFDAAKDLLAESIQRWPEALGPRLILSHALLQEGRDLRSAERALRDVLALVPDHREAQHNLNLLLRQQERHRPLEGCG